MQDGRGVVSGTCGQCRCHGSLRFPRNTGGPQAHLGSSVGANSPNQGVANGGASVAAGSQLLPRHCHRFLGHCEVSGSIQTHPTRRLVCCLAPECEPENAAAGTQHPWVEVGRPPPKKGRNFGGQYDPAHELKHPTAAFAQGFAVRSKHPRRTRAGRGSGVRCAATHSNGRDPTWLLLRRLQLHQPGGGGGGVRGTALEARLCSGCRAVTFQLCAVLGNMLSQRPACCWSCGAPPPTHARTHLHPLQTPGCDQASQRDLDASGVGSDAR